MNRLLLLTIKSFNRSSRRSIKRFLKKNEAEKHAFSRLSSSIDKFGR